MSNNDILISIKALGFPWATEDPFLFCVHHRDAYPAGNEHMGPVSSLAGRNIGQDFANKDGWNMYHGEVVPGFPQHPHRGFETVTVARSGYIDHSDSLGATARFGHGDAQWMTAGRGIVHSEMFPLVHRDKTNPAELFQIWLNLPTADKMVEPHFTMLWNDVIPKKRISDDKGHTTELTMVAGSHGDTQAPPPPPKSWAARPDSDVAIWTIKLAPNARFTLPAARAGSNRNLYFFRGNGLSVHGQVIPPYSGVKLRADAAVQLVGGTEECEVLLLQGRPIGEPVVQYGPFVMSSPQEIQRAFQDYQRTQFGGWPWPSHGPVHPRDEGRFARHADGRFEKKG